MPPIFVDARNLAERLDVSYDTVLTWVRREASACPRWARTPDVQLEQRHRVLCEKRPQSKGVSCA